MKRPDEEAPAPDEPAGAGARTSDDQASGSTAGDAGSAIQREARQDLGLIGDLTDIPEVKAYADRIGARSRSLRKLVVEQRVSRYAFTLAEITFATDGEITAPDEYAPTDQEAQAIRAAWPRYRWPEYHPFFFTGRHAPERDKRVPWSMADADNLAICWDRERKHILCVEERRARDDGGKDIFIWTHWSDGRWRIAEPPGGLPLFGLDTIGDAATIFVHEGPKAAKAIQKLVADDDETGWRSHPWGAELRGWTSGAVAHVGWMGGANRPGSTDWSPLLQASPRWLYIVCDNDDPGRNAVRTISRRLLRPMAAVEFDDRFPAAFDMADPIPARLFEERDGKLAYIGPPLRELMQPATWATRQLPQPEQEDGRRQRGQAGFAVRPEFAREWLYIVTLGMFVNRDNPAHFYTVDQFNILVRPVSDVKDTAALLHTLRSVKVHGVIYDPGQPSGVVNVRGLLYINVHVPSGIKATAGDPRPFLRYLRHLIPARSDRLHVERWVATLLARPSVRMEYALMLMSETQGVGKTTLAEHILTPLLGKENVSTPNETEVTDGTFTDWIANKRLVSIDEIYAGHSRKTYDALKGRITGTTTRVNKKFQPAYEIENWAHFVVSSNSKVPLFMDSKDRRWFIPEVTEAVKPREYWEALHRWLANGGLGIILHWAERFVASKRGAVRKGEHAPASAAKSALVEASLSDEMRLIRDVAEELSQRGRADPPERVLFTLDHFREWLAAQASLQGRKRMSGQAVQNALRNAGLIVRSRNDRTGVDERVKVDGRNRAVVLNFEPGAGEKWPELVRTCRRAMDALMTGEPL